MKSPIFCATLLAATVAVAMPQDIGIPEPPTCPPGVDKAIDVGKAAFKLALRLHDVPNLDKSIDAGVACFKYELGCADAPPEINNPPGDLDCSTYIDAAIAVGHTALKNSFGLFLPKRFDEAVVEGIRCFKETLGCKQPEA